MVLFQVEYCPYKLSSKDSYLYFCRELCYKEYTAPAESSAPLLSANLTPAVCAAPVASAAEPDRPFERKCSQCTAKIIPSDEKVLTWETMDFCTDECLGTYFACIHFKLGSVCFGS